MGATGWRRKPIDLPGAIGVKSCLSQLDFAKCLLLCIKAVAGFLHFIYLDMLAHLFPIGALLAGTALLLLGTGLLNTVLALRGAAEGFGNATMGLLGSAYFAGFLIGTHVCPGLIRRTGHVRAFAFFAASAAACVQLHTLLVAPLPWAILRVATGLALVGLYTVIESWLNSQAAHERRSQIFAIYMAVNLGALALAQQLLQVADPLAFAPFAIATILICLAVTPVSATRFSPPALTHAPRQPLLRLWRAAPAACSGAMLSGLCMGAFWGLSAVYGQRIGLTDTDVAMLMTLTILGGALAQWPIGRVSDRIDRRRALGMAAGAACLAALGWAVAGVAGKAVLTAAFVFGCFAFALYPIVVAHLIDHLAHEEILSGSAALLLLHGVGAAIGPALAGLAMAHFGAHALPLHFASMLAPLCLHALLQARRGADAIVEAAAQFIPMVRTSPTVLEMMHAEARSESDPHTPSI